ncbi:MAG: hypothetical protein Q8P79_01060 [Nanoarchaeota archaeon]|nr:hypothetical protein [Nanoarchaeota archaeon]
MRKITEKGLRRHLGDRVWIEREGIKGNIIKENGTIKEGELAGILQEDANGFYVKMFKTHWGEMDTRLGKIDGLIFDEKQFLDEIYRIWDRDVIRAGGEYLIRLQLEKR